MPRHGEALFVHVHRDDALDRRVGGELDGVAPAAAEGVHHDPAQRAQPRGDVHREALGRHAEPGVPVEPHAAVEATEEPPTLRVVLVGHAGDGAALVVGRPPPPRAVRASLPPPLAKHPCPGGRGGGRWGGRRSSRRGNHGSGDRRRRRRCGADFAQPAAKEGLLSALAAPFAARGARGALAIAAIALAAGQILEQRVLRPVVGRRFPLRCIARLGRLSPRLRVARYHGQREPASRKTLRRAASAGRSWPSRCEST